MENKRLNTVNIFLRSLPEFSMHAQTLKTYILIFVYTIMILALLMTIFYIFNNILWHVLFEHIQIYSILFNSYIIVFLNCTLICIPIPY